MKALKVAKFQVLDSLKSIGIYYAIFIAVIVFLAWAGSNLGGNVTSSGLEMSTAIFIFVAGLNSFKSSFKLSQANNISRKAFLGGAVMAAIPLSLGMSTIDLIINRIFNIFIKSPTSFDMLFSSLRGIEVRDGIIGDAAWVQVNSISTLFGTVIWQFALYASIYLLGLLISLLYYRCNKLLKTLVSITPVVIMMVLPQSVWIGIMDFMNAAFGYKTGNPYMAVLSCFILALAFSAFAFLLIRRAVPRE